MERLSEMKKETSEIHYCFDEKDHGYIYHFDGEEFFPIATNISQSFFDRSLENAVMSFTYSPVIHDQKLFERLNKKDN